MFKLLNLFIRRDFSLWQLEYNYGDLLATDSGRVADHVSLQTDQTDRYLYAACSGELSVGLPVFTSVRLEQLSEDVIDEPFPETVDLVLMLNPLVRSTGQFLGSSMLPLGFDQNLQAFQYFNVDVQSLMDDLRELLRWSTIPPADINISDAEVAQRMDLFLKGMLSVYVEGGQRLGKPGRKAGTSSPTLYQVGFSALINSGLWSPGDIYDRMRGLVEEEQDVNDFLVLVPKPPTPFSGAASKTAAIQMTETMLYNWTDLLGLKKDWSLSVIDWRQVGDNQKALYRQRLLARSGLLPSGIQVPAFEFNSQDWKNLFQLEAVVEYYANFDDPWVPNAVPLDVSENGYSQLDRASLTIQGNAATIRNGRITLDGNPELEKVRKEQHYIYLENSEKEHWFRITDIDNSGKSVKAIDSKGVVARFPGGVSSSPWRINQYTSIDFLPLNGSAASINGDEIILDGNPDFSRIKTRDTTDSRCLCDGIIFEAEPTRMYLIKSIIPGQKKLILSVEVSLSLNGATSAWQISHVPVIVQIDPLGPREGLKGSMATRISTNIIKLEQPSPNLEKVNNYGFETIYLPADIARPSKTYRINSVNAGDKTVALDGDPSLTAGAVSNWSIPAGLGGELPSLEYNLGPGRQKLKLPKKANPPKPARPAEGPLVEKGFDHYDGVMYVVDNGEVNPQFRWTSYTSRADQEEELLSPEVGLSDPEGNHRSIRGNHRYEVFSIVTPKSAYRNYCFRINDQLNADNVFEARGYFESNPTFGGQEKIRIHYGNTESPGGSGSAGCNVSPEFYEFRQALINIYQRRYTLQSLEGTGDTEVAKLDHRTRKSSETIWKNSFLSGNEKKNVEKLNSEEWNFKIFCYYWLIRPGERPVR